MDIKFITTSGKERVFLNPEPNAESRYVQTSDGLHWNEIWTYDGKSYLIDVSGAYDVIKVAYSFQRGAYSSGTGWRTIGKNPRVINY